MPSINSKEHILQTVPYPNLFWYHLNDMSAKKIQPESFSNIVTMHILCKAYMEWSKNTSETKNFARDSNMLLQSHQILSIFGSSVLNKRELV